MKLDSRFKLLKSGVIRKKKCPKCGKEYWVHLEKARMKVDERQLWKVVWEPIE